MKHLIIASVCKIVACSSIAPAHPAAADLHGYVIHAATIDIRASPSHEDIDEIVTLLAAEIGAEKATIDDVGSLDQKKATHLAKQWGLRSRSYDIVFARLLSRYYWCMLTPEVIRTVTQRIQDHPELIDVIRQERLLRGPLAPNRWALAPKDATALSKGQKFYILLVQSSLMKRPDWVLNTKTAVIDRSFNFVQDYLRSATGRIHIDAKQQCFFDVAQCSPNSSTTND